MQLPTLYNNIEQQLPLFVNTTNILTAYCQALHNILDMVDCIFF